MEPIIGIPSMVVSSCGGAVAGPGISSANGSLHPPKTGYDNLKAVSRNALYYRRIPRAGAGMLDESYVCHCMKNEGRPKESQRPAIAQACSRRWQHRSDRSRLRCLTVHCDDAPFTVTQNLETMLAMRKYRYFLRSPAT